MKKSEIETYIRKFILPNFPDYYLAEYVMYKTFGEGFFLKGYLFYSKGNNEMGLKINYFVLPLFVKEDRITYTFGDELSNIIKKGLFKKSKTIFWDTRPEKQAESFIKISNAINKQGEPVLNKFLTAKDYYNLQKGERSINVRILESIAYTSILTGNIKLQNRMLNGLLKELDKEDNWDWVKRIKSDTELLISIGDSDGRIKLLKDWANETLNNLKLPHLKQLQ